MLPSIIFSRRAPKRFCSAIASMRKPAALHQREFRGNVKSVGGEQEYGEQQTGDRVVHRVKSFSARNARTSRRIDIAGDEGLADAAHQDEGEPAALEPSCPARSDPSSHRSSGQLPPGTALTWVGRPTAARCAMTRSASASATSPRRAENSNASAMPSADRLAVQQPVGEAGGRLERMAEGVAEIEQHAVAGLALVARDDRGLGAAAHRDGVLARMAPPANRSRQLASSQAKKAASPSSPYFTTSA